MKPTSLALLLILSACASGNYQGLARRTPNLPDPTLSVAPVREQIADTVVTQYKDDNGANIASAETITGYHTVTSGFALQRGGETIDEQDYYELAKDRDGFDAIERARTRGKIMNRLGYALIIAGTATAIAVPVALGTEGSTIVKALAVGQWFVSFPVGLAFAIVGAHKFDHHVLSVARAFSAIGQTPPHWADQLR